MSTAPDRLQSPTIPRSPFPIPQPIRAVTLELSQARIGVFDARETVDFLAERGVNTIVCFAVGYSRGEAYYPSSVAPEHPDLHGQDLFGEVMDACAAHGIPVIAYVNGLFGGPEFYEPLPDWTQRWLDGSESVQGEAKMMCPNSPWREHIIRVSVEVVARYDVVGFYLDEPSMQSWCTCPFCRERYRRDTGSELPLDPQQGTEEFARFHAWRAGIVVEFVEQVRDAVLAARPGIAFIAQHAFPMASTSLPHLRHLYGFTPRRYPPQWEGWYRTSFYAQDIAAIARSLDIVSIEPWRRFVAQPAWWQGATISYARAAGNGKPVLPLMEYPHFPWGQARLSKDELEVNCADAVANGGEIWFAMYSPDAADRSGWDALRGIFRALDGIRPAGMTQVASSAILFSRLTAERYGAGAVERRYLDDVIGTIQLVREQHVPYKVLSEDALTPDHLTGVQVLYLPSAACLGERAAGIIREWVNAGGRVIATGCLGTHDQRGARREQSLIADLLGLQLGAEVIETGVGYIIARDGSGFPTGRKLPIRDELPRADVTTAKTLFEASPTGSMYAQPIDTTAGTAVTVNRVGNGAVAWCGAQLGRLRRRYEMFEAAEIVRAMLQASNAPRPPIEGIAIAPEVGLYAWRNERELQIILVNYTSIETTGEAALLVGPGLRIDPEFFKGKAHFTSHRGDEVIQRTPGTPLDRMPEDRVALGTLRTWDCIRIFAE